MERRPDNDRSERARGSQNQAARGLPGNRRRDAPRDHAKMGPPDGGNTTAETYVQGSVPQSSSSCIMCHNNATLAGSGRPSDFTYILENAH
jgi:hypothetical protein